MGTVNLINVGFHFGNVIKYLAQTYGDGFMVLREGVQNAIDKRSSKIHVRVDCLKAIIQIFDDGIGASSAEITKKFENIGMTLKSGDPDAIGEKGIGNLAGIAVAREWQLITRDRENPADQYCMYTFAREQLENSKSLSVHCEISPSMRSVAGTTFPAQTMLRLLDVDKLTLQQLGNSDAICRTMTDAFGTKIKARGIELRVLYKDFKGKIVEFLVKPPPYRGSAMDVEKYDTKYGEVELVFYHSPRPLAHPNILVQHRGVTGIPLANFFKLKVIGKQTEELFAKGYFEGEIRLAYCEMNAIRGGFVQNEQLQDFVQVIETFANSVLRPIIDQLEQEGRQDRHKRIADQLVKKVRGHFIKHPNNLPPTIKVSFLKSVGESSGVNGTGTPKKKQKTTVAVPKVGITSDEFKKQRQRNATPSPKKKETQTMVLDEGLGLQMVYPDANEEGFAWHSRTTSAGTIELNAANNDFLDTERRGQGKLLEYMFILLMKELACASHSTVEAKMFDGVFEKSFMRLWRASLDF